MSAASVPTRREEAWRYSDMEALTRLWPLPAPESIVVPAGGDFKRAIIQDEGAIRQIDMSVGKGATASLHILNIGGAYGRIELNVTLHEGADFALGAAQIGGGEQNLEIVTTVIHAEPGATSRQVVRSVLGGTATGTYLGKVAVARDAQQTDSEQDVKAMLLDRSATANAKPELEIFADDVKCAHGATVGELDRDQLFYAAARGLDPASARALLLEGFVGGLWDEVEGDDQGVAELARAALKAVA